MLPKFYYKKKNLFLLIILGMSFLNSLAQGGWTTCNAVTSFRRIDDIFMVNALTGFAVNGDGLIMKSIDGGNNWFALTNNPNIYCRSVEFLNPQIGFVGAFTVGTSGISDILQRTIDGGITWTDQTSLLNPKAQQGICGLAAADSITIYGCGNWFEDSAYVIKSNDAGLTWNFIDMHNYAASLIDMHFLNKDTGFVTGSSPLPMRTAIILYTTDGGISWTTKFVNNIPNEYCWKIQKLNSQIYFASIEDLTAVNPRVLKSIDGGMNWNVIIVDTSIINYDIEGIGFIDSLNGWTGGDKNYSYETKDGGITWDSISACPYMNRVLKLNDSLMIACGSEIWKYNKTTTSVIVPFKNDFLHTAAISCFPNPSDEQLTIKFMLEKPTHSLILIFDALGNRLQTIDNTDRAKGEYKLNFMTKFLPSGNYYIILKTHEGKYSVKFNIIH